MARKQKPVPMTPVPMTSERYEQFLDEVENLMMAFNRQASEQASKETHFCSTGCDTCCYQVFQVATFEAEVIARRIKRDADLLARIQKTVAGRKAQVAALQDEIANVRTNTDYLKFITEWLRLKIPCALLDQNQCQVYDIRPATCAVYLSMAPPSICAIDPKGYRSAAMQKIFQNYEQSMLKLHEAYGIPRVQADFDISVCIDRLLNPQATQDAGDGNEKAK